MFHSVIAQDDGADFGMTGIMLGGQGEMRVVASVLPHSPAAEAGIEQGDTIRAINGVGTTDLALNDIVAKIRGKPGTEVTLVVTSRETGVVFSHTLKRVSAFAYQSANPPN